MPKKWNKLKEWKWGKQELLHIFVKIRGWKIRALGPALRNSTGRGSGLSWMAERETPVNLRCPRLEEEKKLFLPASLACFKMQ